MTKALIVDAREKDSFVTGRLGALLGDAVVTAEPGTWVFKPRQQWHTFWHAGGTPCEIIEVISPAGFEKYFREVAASRETWPLYPHQPEVRARDAV